MEIFRKTSSGGRGCKTQPRSLSLSIEGVGQAPITPEPDEAEKAAQALLTAMATKTGRKRWWRRNRKAGPEPAKGTPEYYRALAGKVAAVHEQERRAALRYVAYCEQEMRVLPFTAEHLAELEAGLYKHLDTVDREEGELKKRWQYCLADITLQQIEIVRNEPIEQ